jgi:hypothetical protein
MLTSQVNVSSATFSPWLKIDQTQNAFGVGFSVTLSSGATLTYSIQHTSDPMGKVVNGTITRSGTAVNVLLPNHGLSVGDFVKVMGANTGPTDVFDGEFAVASVVDANNFTYTVANAGATEARLEARIVTLRVRDNDFVVGETTSQDGNYEFPPTACRLIVTAWTSGTATLTMNQGRK